MLRVLAAVGTVVGLLTGLATIIGWLVSDSMSATLGVVLPIAGWIYTILVGVGLTFVLGGYGWYLVGARRALPWLTLGLAFIFFHFIIFSLVGSDYFASFYGVAGPLTFAAGYIWYSVVSYRDSHGTCQECLQTVKRDATICFHCGSFLCALPQTRGSSTGAVTSIRYTRRR